MSRPVAPAISDHALVRFLQRSGLDVEAVRAELGRGLARAHGAALEVGAGECVIVADGLKYLVRDRVVVTVLHGRARVR